MESVGGERCGLLRPVGLSAPQAVLADGHLDRDEDAAAVEPGGSEGGPDAFRELVGVEEGVWSSGQFGAQVDVESAEQRSWVRRSLVGSGVDPGVLDSRLLEQGRECVGGEGLDCGRHCFLSVLFCSF